MEIHDKIFSWWQVNREAYPWRETTDPYYILVSEIMLQQTQTTRVVPKYLAFIQKFPDLKTLAEASKGEILALWSGLGYNRRAIYLQQTAQSILQLDEFPRDPKALIKLPGIGVYTSRSIPIFAFNADIGTVDTNIRKVFIAEGLATPDTKQNELFKIADRLVPKGRSRDWHNALMDYGSKIASKIIPKIRSTAERKPFHETDRHYRGIIIKKLLKSPMTSEQLQNDLKIGQKRLEALLQTLQTEGLIRHAQTEWIIE